MINCPNPSCKTANPEGAQVCQVCQRALPYFYLWGVGDLVSTLKVNSVVNQRYLLKRDHVFLDVNPGLMPESPPDLPDFLSAYLHLSAYPLHVPRVYSVMKTPDDDYVTMLESSALATVADASSTSSSLHQDAEQPVPEMLPELANQWISVPPLRQLNWLWQMAQMWEAFSQERVAATLLNSTLVRADGSIVRLLALEAGQPTLMDLGRYWQSLAETASQAVRAFLERLCEQLERQQLSAEDLCDCLSSAMAVCAQGQLVNYDLAVYTDQGPTRKRNEDACYPESGAVESVSAAQTLTHPQLLLVCDGIGGHQGGDVASKLAIETIRAQLAPVLAADAPDLSSLEMTLAIETAICAANDEISAQNDQAQRQARDRMGTTLVLALIKGADVYIAHLGDSRAYRIGRHNCQQVTLDDDVASRQVRLAGGLYREALTQPGSGSLIQALGMGPSQTLRPTVQRFAVDEDCLFLLCSDGLSDSDRVEQFWQSVLRPLVVGPGSTAQVGQQLVEIANKYNGHDNVTVGLINAKVTQHSERIVPRELAVSAQDIGAQAGGNSSGDMASTITSLPAGKQKRQRPQTGLVPLESSGAASESSEEIDLQKSATKGAAGSLGLNKAVLALIGLAVLGCLAYFLVPGLSDRFSPSVSSYSGGLDSIDSGQKDDVSSTQTATDSVALSEGAYVRIRQSSIAARPAEPPTAATEEADSPIASPGVSDNEALPIPEAQKTETQILLYPQPEDRRLPNTVAGTIPVGAIAQIIALRPEVNPEWVQLKVCTIPSGDRLSEVPVEGAAPREEVPNLEAPLTQSGAVLLPNGAEGWALVDSLSQFTMSVPAPSNERTGSCDT